MTPKALVLCLACLLYASGTAISSACVIEDYEEVRAKDVGFVAFEIPDGDFRGNGSLTYLQHNRWRLSHPTMESHIKLFNFFYFTTTTTLNERLTYIVLTDSGKWKLYFRTCYLRIVINLKHGHVKVYKSNSTVPSINVVKENYNHILQSTGCVTYTGKGQIDGFTMSQIVFGCHRLSRKRTSVESGDIWTLRNPYSMKKWKFSQAQPYERDVIRLRRMRRPGVRIIIKMQYVKKHVRFRFAGTNNSVRIPITGLSWETYILKNRSMITGTVGTTDALNRYSCVTDDVSSIYYMK